MTRNEVRSKENLNPVEGGDVFENPAITTKENQPETQRNEETQNETRTTDV
jgi:hypothetical protein